ncbi:phage major capsid protein [Arthrobacter sp. H-02-3]|uniref:phage major capsid protein n=1 Tax=Arthrobacter sp. H-02-3 TaxID=2703675 RepID=UPI000DD1EFA4|nr:phage major capsid protein [Arthrobacter sp. H-02-3]PVZ53032.1 phage major capsid protein [Arthrobacter sp. H-02-3]
MEFKTRIDRHREAAAAAAKSAREIAEKADADGVPLTGAQLAEYQQNMVKARHHLDSLKTAKSDEDITAQARALAAEIGDPVRGEPKAAQGAWAKATAARMAKAMTAEIDGQKSLVSGSIGVPSPIETDIVTMSAAPRSLLELIPAKGLGGGFDTGNSFSFLRQTVRTNNAAPVADGALKPTSVYTLAEVEDRVRVIAHLSEPVPERYFADHANLEDFLRNEMESGLYQALENQALQGDGTGENLTGLLNTSGIITQAFATDALTSIRKAMTSLEVYGITPTALVLNPVDAEALDLLRDSGATGKYLLGDPAGDGVGKLWKVPRVRSNAVAAGTALLGDWQQAQIVIREDATLALDRSGSNFSHNLVTIRLEGRFGFAVKRPNAFVEIALAAA